MEKGCGSGSAPFSSTISIISIRGGETRQSFGLYFRILFMELAGKSGKWGLDKICDGGAPPAARSKSTFWVILCCCEGLGKRAAGFAGGYGSRLASLKNRSPLLCVSLTRCARPTHRKVRDEWGTRPEPITSALVFVQETRDQRCQDCAYPHFEHPSERQHARNGRPGGLRKVAGHSREESDDHPDF